LTGSVERVLVIHEPSSAAPQVKRDSLGGMMKPNVILTTSSLVTILLVTFHLADDMVRQMEPANLSNLVAETRSVR